MAAKEKSTVSSASASTALGDAEVSTGLAFQVQIKTISDRNAREHWRTTYGRKKKQKEAIDQAWSDLQLDHNPVLINMGLPARVRFTRLAPGLLDDDNLTGALKYVRDQIARHLEVDDGPKGPVIWEYSQEKIRRSGPTGYYVLIELRWPRKELISWFRESGCKMSGVAKPTV